MKNKVNPNLEMELNPNYEYRFIKQEVRVLESEVAGADNIPKKKKKIVGYAAVFDSLSDDLGGYREIIRKGSFSKSVQEADVRSLVNHNPEKILGRSKSGTLTIQEDDIGLITYTDPPETSYAKDLEISINRGDIDQMSFAFRVPKDRDRWYEQDGEIIREITTCELFDISPVTFPAYPQTIVGMRSIDKAELRDIVHASSTLTSNELCDKVKTIREQPEAKPDFDILKKRLEIVARDI